MPVFGPRFGTNCGKAEGAAWKHCKIAKGCLEYIASVVEVSSCSNQNTYCQKLIFSANRFFIQLCQNFSLHFYENLSF